MSNHRVTIVFGVRYGGFLKMLLHGGVIRRLIELGANIVIAAPEKSAAAFAKEKDLKSVSFFPLKRQNAKLELILGRVRRFLFSTILPTDTSQSIADQLKLTNPFQYWIISTLQGKPMWVLFAIWRYTHRLLISSKLTEDLFTKYEPDLVVVPSLGRGEESFRLLRCAQRFGTRTLCTVSSWDVLTTKEYPLERPDKLIVWNMPNKEQACKIFKYAPDDVFVSGPPHFDVYASKEQILEKATLFNSLGLALDRELLFVTGQPSIPREDVFSSLQALANLVEKDLLCKRCQILFRPHPMTFLDKGGGFGTEKDLKLCEELGSHVHVNRPQRDMEKLDIDVNQSDANTLIAILWHMSILLDFFGTLSGEACIVDKPQIYLGIGSSLGGLGNLPIHRRTGYTHVRLLLENGAGRVVRTIEELKTTIDLYLNDRNHDSEGRRLAANLIAYRSDGLAGHRMAMALHCYARGIWSPEMDVQPFRR